VSFQFTPSLLLLAAVAPLGLWLGWHAWRNRRVPGALPFAAVAVIAAVWAVGDALELASTDLQTKLLWADLQYLAIVSIPVAWLVMALDYTGRRAWLTRLNIVAMCVIPLVSLTLMWTNSHHHLMRANAWLDTSGPYVVVGRTFGFWFWVHAAYSYILIAVAMVFLFKAIFSFPPLYRWQPVVLLTGIAVSMIWNVVYLLAPGVLPAHDFTPAVFVVAGLIIAWGLFRLRLFTLVPVARHALVESMTEGLVVLDEADRVVDLNEAARVLIGGPVEEIIARPLAESWRAWPQLAAPYAAGSDRAQMSFGENGDRREYEVKISPLSRRGQVMGRLLMVRDVTERALMEESLRHQALTDGLTGLPNRTLFMAKLGDAIRQARRHSGSLFAVIVLDLDRFKLINDSIGHPAGDVLLESIAVKLKQCVREADTVARMGGDEFMILLHEIASTRDVTRVIERIQEELLTPVVFRQQEMTTTASLGVVVWDPFYQDPEDLLRAADTAMYQAKEAGRACYRIFDEQMHKSVLRTLRAETELRAALKQKDLSLAYQPVMNLKTGAISSLETLVRWHRSQRGTVLPEEFIDIAERSGLIIPLGELVLDEVCCQLSRWRTPENPATGLPVSLNISPRQLTETDFVGAILTRLAEWRVPPSRLILELTETALIRDPRRSKQVMEELRNMGIRLCLDDFGTGWSSLRHLTTYPVQELKIDHSFISRIARDNTEFEIVRSITALAHTLGLTVTGEGVEYSEQLGLLKELGCDSAQGYYVGRPMKPEELLDYLEDLGRGSCETRWRTETPATGAMTPTPAEQLTWRDIAAPVWYHRSPLYNKQP